MKLHLVLSPVLVILSLLPATAQNVTYQTDQHIVNQQERMVFKQWERRKFTPRSGFLGLNYQYWLTWGLHPNYPKTDLRPLSATGPQTQRMALVLAMQHVDNNYRLHADTLRNTAMTEAANYSGLVADGDPLWSLYYRREFSELTESADSGFLEGIPENERAYLTNRGVTDWYAGERAELKERLEAARRTTLERGSRILAYHRMLAEYRALKSSWDAKKRNAAKFIALNKKAEAIRKSGRESLGGSSTRTDVQIANDILNKTHGKHGYSGGN